MGDHDSAIRWNEEALRIDRELGDDMGENMRLNSMASIQRERGDLGAALSLNLESLAIITKLGTKYLRAKVHINCGKLCLSLGDPDEALKHYLAAARLSRQTEFTRDEGYSLMGAGIALEQRGDPAGAAESYRQATELLQTVYEESGAPEELFGKAEDLTLLGAVLHHSLEKPVEAMNAYEEAAGIYRGLADPPKLRKLLMNMAGLRWRTGDPEGSARHYEEALKIAREHGEAAHEAAALASLSVVHRELGCLKESLRCGRGALALLRDVKDLQAEAYVLSSLAESHLGLGHHPSALSCLKRSMRLRRKVGDKEGEVGFSTTWPRFTRTSEIRISPGEPWKKPRPKKGHQGRRRSRLHRGKEELDAQVHRVSDSRQALRGGDPSRRLEVCRSPGPDAGGTLDPLLLLCRGGQDLLRVRGPKRGADLRACPTSGDTHRLRLRGRT